MSYEQSSEQRSRAEQIAQLNDAFRQQLNDWYLTQGARTVRDWAGMVRAVQGFNEFTPDNDPYGEHDFGAFDWENKRLFWKIDYYDQQLKYGEDALSELCRRVMTIMRADEY
jgi:Protein of unknown function (DUF3768)